MKNPRDRIIIIVLMSALLLTVFSMLIYSANEISVSAKSAVLYEPCEKRFLYEKRADEKLPMASTTKIMTALVAIEKSDVDSVVEIPSEAVGIEGSSLYLAEGERILMKELLYGLMLRSANDAAAAIAIHISGTISGFAALMNDKAVELGLKSTNFTNPHGLDDPNHYTTARELAILSAKALENDLFKSIVSTKKHVIKNLDGDARLVVNHNKLLSLYDDSIGVKTGYTKRSGRSLVGSAERDGLRFITVTINAPDDWSDHTRLLDYGFSLLKMHTLAMPGDFSYKIPVINGQKPYLTVSNVQECKIILQTGVKAPEAFVELDRYVNAPIKLGDVLGKVKFISEDKVLYETELVATEEIKAENKKLFNIF